MQQNWICAGIMEFTQLKKRKRGVTKGVVLPVHPLWLEELSICPTGRSLCFTSGPARWSTRFAIQERLWKLMSEPAVQEMISGLIAREMIVEDVRFTFHGLRKERVLLPG